LRKAGKAAEEKSSEKQEFSGSVHWILVGKAMYGCFSIDESNRAKFKEICFPAPFKGKQGTFLREGCAGYRFRQRNSGK